MKLTPDHLSDESQAMANDLLVARPQQKTDTRLDDFAYGNFNVTTAILKSGKTGITIDRYTIAPDQGGDSPYEPFGESIELIYDTSGQLEVVRDIPTGYEARWSIDRIADTLLPERRKQKQERIAARTEGLVRAAKRLISHDL